MNAMHTIPAISLPGGWEWIILLAIGLLIVGKSLPEVGRSLGKSIVEFKKGLKGVQDEIERASEEGDDQADMLPPPSASTESSTSTSSAANQKEKEAVS